MITDSNLPCRSPEHFKFCHRKIKKAIQQAWNLQAGGKLSYSYWMSKQKVIAVGDGFPKKSVISPSRQTTTEYVATNCWCDVCQKHTTIRSIIPIGNVVSWLRQKIPSDVAVNFVDFLPFLTALLLFVEKSDEMI